jgi:steroid 5-alpha reductase family enzyme
MENFSIGAALIFGSLSVLWVVSVLIRNASIIDIVWGAGFVLLMWTWRILADVPASDVLTAIVTIWGIRLSIYIGWRNIGKGEDPRYVEMRQRAGHSFWWRSLYKVFWLQGTLMLIIALPLLAANERTTFETNLALDSALLLVWLCGFAFEAGGDWQLARFKKNAANRGKVCDRGFWRYTRHPNYFGDALQWWAFGVYGAAVSGQWWVLISPVIMNFFLVHVSGAKLLEQSLAKSKPQYAEYIRITSRFVPWPRKML